MKKGWEIKKLGEVATIKGGKRVPKGYSLIKEKTPYPYIRVTDFTEEGTVSLDDIHYIEEEIFQQIKNYFITTNDLYISIAGTIGKTGIVPKELNGANLTENACRLIFNNGIYNRYVLYYTKSNDFIEQAGLNTRTTAMPKLALTRLSEIPISIPPLPEQQRIVSILDEAFAAIDQAKANVQKNLNNAKELFQSELNSVFSKKGDGWVEKKLGEVCEYDKTPNKKTDLPYVGLEDIQSNTGKLIGPITPRSMKSLTFNFTNVHVLYGRLRPYLNKVLLPEFEGHCSTELFPIKPKKDIIDRNYLFHWLISSDTMNKINATWTGATLPRANMNTVLDFKISVPSISEQQKIVSQLDSLSTETKKLETLYQRKLNELEDLKKSILQKAFSGELETNKVAI